jgi:hypothetical protein
MLAIDLGVQTSELVPITATDIEAAPHMPGGFVEV